MTEIGAEASGEPCENVDGGFQGTRGRDARPVADQLEAIAADESIHWTQRFQAIRRLKDNGTLDSVKTPLEATADGPEWEGIYPQTIDENAAYINPPTIGSEAVRSAALQALIAIVRRVEVDTQLELRSILESALHADDPRVRLAALRKAFFSGSGSSRKPRSVKTIMARGVGEFFPDMPNEFDRFAGEIDAASDRLSLFAMLEASRAALVLADIPTYRELWSQAALFFDPRDPDALASAIDRLAGDPDLRREMGDRALARSRIYSPHLQARAMAGIYRALLPLPAPPLARST